MNVDFMWPVLPEKPEQGRVIQTLAETIAIAIGQMKSVNGTPIYVRPDHDAYLACATAIYDKNWGNRSVLK